MAVFPENDTELVEQLGNRLGVDLDKMFTLTNVDGQCSSYDYYLGHMDMLAYILASHLSGPGFIPNQTQSEKVVVAGIRRFLVQKCDQILCTAFLHLPM